MYCPECLNTFEVDGAACPNLMCGGTRPDSGWGELLAPGDLFDRHYQIERLLALAGAGLTYLAREVDGDGKPTGPELAIKVLYAHRDTGPYLRRLANEAQILRELDNPYIVEYQGFVQRRGKPPYLITTFESGGTLWDHIRKMGPLSADVAAGVLRQILGALVQAHKRGVIHRDLKPQNVLLREPVGVETMPRIRVADFGIAKLADGLSGGLTRAGMFVGTPEFAAPEQFLGQPATPATDVFAAAGLLHYLVTARIFVPFSQRTDLSTCYEELIAATPLQLSAADRLRPGMGPVQAVLDGAMVANADERLGIERILAVLDGVYEVPEEPRPPELPRVADAPRPADTPRSAPTPVWVEPAPRAVDDDRDSNLMTLDDLFAMPARSNARTLDGIEAARAARRPEPVEAPGASPDLFFDEPTDKRPGGVVPVKRDFRSAPQPIQRPAPQTIRPAVHAPLPFPPHTGAPLPDPLPSSLSELVALIPAAPLDRRGAIVAAVERADPTALSRLATGWRPGTDPAVGEGLAFFAAATGRTDWASRLRGFLTDPSPRVRWSAATALGIVGLVASLSALGPLLKDPDPDVRAVAARALARAAARAQRNDLARTSLRALATDPDPRVQEAVREALAEVE